QVIPPMNTELVPQSPPVLIPRDDALQHVRAVARLMDTAFVLPGTRFRIGLDPLLGLIPGIGDLIGAAISTYIVLVAAELGVSRAVVLRMFLNIAIDTVGGSVPVVGDVFDAAWKANAMNVALLERALAEPHRTHRSSVWLLIGIAAGGLLLVAGGGALTVWVLQLVSSPRT